MGAFILFPVLIFSIFITAIMGFTDYIHVAILVHGAAQAAVQAAAESASAVDTNGIYLGGSGGTTKATVDSGTVNSTVGGMLNGKPYITGYSCSINGSQVTCTVNFTVSMPIVGKVNTVTTATSQNLIH